MGFATDEQVADFLKQTPAVERAMISSGIILLKYWLDLDEDEQTRRLRERITDGRKTWKLSPMDLESYQRWYDYSRARDAMFAATDTTESPWYVVNAINQRRARLNCIAHFLSKIPYEELPRDEITLPARQPRGDYEESTHPFRYVPEAY